MNVSGRIKRKREEASFRMIAIAIITRGRYAMRLQITNTEYVFNRATRQKERHDYFVADAAISDEIKSAISCFATRHGLSFADVVMMALHYYFGDGENHLLCEHCGFFVDGCSLDALLDPKLQPGTQTTVPLLDKGTVVVGLSMSEQGE